MLSNVTKSADVLRGATEMQDLWVEVEKETPHAGLKGPRAMTDAIMNGYIMNEQEKRDELELTMRKKQQKNNFYMSESAKKLKNRKTDMPASERKAIQNRLAARPAHSQPRPKSPTGRGHMLATGEESPGRAGSVKATTKVPNSRAAVSTPGTVVKSSRARERTSRFEGLTMQDFYQSDWRPSFTYRPAKQDKPWECVEGFAMSTRTLERRKMDPFADINSFTGNKHSAKAQFNAHAHVRPLDNKGALGARPVQMWKETLREDFARDDDNYSSGAHDANLDQLRKAMGGTDFFSDIE